MRRYCQLLGIINLFGFSGCVLWLLGDTSGSGAPIVGAVLTLNMAMAWLFLAGVRRNAAGERVWEGDAAIKAVILFLMLAAVPYVFKR